MQISTSANRHKSHKAPPLALANWPEGTAGGPGQSVVPRKPTVFRGHAVGRPRGMPLALSRFPFLPRWARNGGCGPCGRGETGKGQEVGGLSGSEEGFGHGWSGWSLPCSAIQSQAAATVDIGLESTPGLDARPSRAGLQGCKGFVGSEPCPETSTAYQPGMRSLSHLVSK